MSEPLQPQPNEPNTAIIMPVTNLLERLFGEERRRTKVIPHVFGERAVLKLMYAALIRAAERWRGGSRLANSNSVS
jgi:transposase-like protein